MSQARGAAARSPVFDVVDYYSEHYDEHARLVEPLIGRLEFARTHSLLKRLLPPPPARLLDVGGGTGVHAEWLMRDGYDVRLVDLIPQHVETARRRGLDATVGDARSLDLRAGSVDAVLLLGPLYHLAEYDDRVQALREAARVARPGGAVAAAAISRYASLLDFAVRGLVDETTGPMIEGTLRTGRHDPRLGFTTAHFHTREEFVREFVDAGLAAPEVYGIEGPAWQVLKAVEKLVDAEARLTSALRVARLVETDRSLVAASAHLLAFAATPGAGD